MQLIIQHSSYQDLNIVMCEVQVTCDGLYEMTLTTHIYHNMANHLDAQRVSLHCIYEPYDCDLN